MIVSFMYVLTWRIFNHSPPFLTPPRALLWFISVPGPQVLSKLELLILSQTRIKFVTVTLSTSFLIVTFCTLQTSFAKGKKKCFRSENIFHRFKINGEFIIIYFDWTKLFIYNFKLLSKLSIVQE